MAEPVEVGAAIQSILAVVASLSCRAQLRLIKAGVIRYDEAAQALREDAKEVEAMSDVEPIIARDLALKLRDYAAAFERAGGSSPNLTVLDGGKASGADERE